MRWWEDSEFKVWVSVPKENVYIWLPPHPVIGGPGGWVPHPTNEVFDWLADHVGDENGGHVSYSVITERDNFKFKNENDAFYFQLVWG